MVLFDKAAKLGKASEAKDVFIGGRLIMLNVLDEWVPKGVAFDLYDFIVGPRDVFF